MILREGRGGWHQTWLGVGLILPINFYDYEAGIIGALLLRWCVIAGIQPFSSVATQRDIHATIPAMEGEHHEGVDRVLFDVWAHLSIGTGD